MKTPRVHIGCPVYRSDETRLRRSLDSLLAQTMGDFEVIICDNSPDDATGAVCAEYVKADPRFRYSHNGINLGAYPSFWRAFAMADAPYFKWHADDDVIAPDYLEKCLTVLDADPSLAICYTKVDIRDEDGSPEDHGENGNINALQEDPAERYLWVLDQQWRAHAFYGVYRTNVLRRVHPASEDGVRLADFALVAEVALYGRIRQIPETLMTYRQQQKDWDDREKLNAQQYEICFPRNPSRGITFPNIKFALELLEAVRYSDLDLEAKSRLYDATPRLIGKRISGLWATEIRRAVTLVLNYRLFHNWGDSPGPVAFELRVDAIPAVYCTHAAELLRRFEEVMQVWPGYPEPGLHSARAVLLAMLDRTEEAQIALELELKTHPDYAPARKMLETLDPQIAV